MLRELPLNQVKMTGKFWDNYVELIKNATIPFQYKVLNDDVDDIEYLRDRKSYSLENLRIAAGLSQGEHHGMSFQDSDVYKWLDAVGCSLQVKPDKELQETADKVVDLIAAAQQADGYIDTYFQLKEPRLKYRMMYLGHELYCMGHLLEACVEYHKATGNQKVLEIARKVVDQVDSKFGYEEGKIHGSDGHPVIELGLLKYYELTGDEKALRMCEFHIDIRGKDPDFYNKEMQRNIEDNLPIDMVDVADKTEYLCAYTQPKNQREVKGHAVRMLYLCAGMARLAYHNHDKEVYEACLALWDNVANKKMYITGGVGSTGIGEAFTGNYDLPNESMYCETCASIALVFFAYDMFKIDPKEEYLEVIERCLYNGILAGASLDGVHFFYVNPMEIHADMIAGNKNLYWIKHIRPNWYSCACCPPNFARCIGSVNRYIYTTDEENSTVYAGLFVESETTALDGKLSIKQETAFPYENTVKFIVKGTGTVKIRVPFWAKDVKVNGDALCYNCVNDGYYTVTVNDEEKVADFTFETPVMAVKANPMVTADANRIAVQKGPFVYCAESVDNEKTLTDFRLTVDDVKNATMEVVDCELGTVPFLTINAKVEKGCTKRLYHYNPETEYETAQLKLIPYYAWANRGAKDMMVWFHQL